MKIAAIFLVLGLLAIFSMAAASPMMMAVAIFFLILEALSRRRFESYTVESSPKRLQRIMERAPTLTSLPPEQRAALSRAIAKDLLLDIRFVHSLVHQSYFDPGAVPEARERTLAVINTSLKLTWEVRKILFLLYFRPKLVLDCQRIFHALQNHIRVWMAYTDLLKATHPELYGNTSIEDAP